MKTSKINKEALKIINTIFYKLLESENKDDWKKAIAFINKKILELENGNRGYEMFIWRSIKKQINNLYGKKYILNKKTGEK